MSQNGRPVVLIADKLAQSTVDALGDGVEVRWVIIAAEPMTGVDTTAMDELVELDQYLSGNGIELVFAEMKDPVKDKLQRLGLGERFGSDHFYPTLETAVEAFENRG